MKEQFPRLLFFPFSSMIMLVILVCCCNSENKQRSINNTGPKTTQTLGYSVPEESIKKPVAITAGTPEAIADIILTSTSLSKNIYPVGPAKVIKAGLFVKHTPGQDSFSLPIAVPAIGKTFKSSSPQSIVVKDANNSDPNPFSFSSFNKLHGFRHAHILDILEDKKGSLWFGGRGGITRYDGRNFTLFTIKEGLPDLRVSCLLEDKKGNLWFGSYGGGLTKYDGLSFTNYTKNEGLTDNDIQCLFEDEIGNIWIGSVGGGITKYNSEIFTHYNQQHGLIKGRVNFITQDKGGIIWILTESGINKFDGVSFFNLVQQEGLPAKAFGGLKDSKGNVWMGSLAEGVFKFDGQTLTKYTTREGLCDNDVTNILEDHYGNLWFSTIDGGISKFDGKTFTNFSRKEGLPNMYIWEILEDKSGNLWLGTSGGVFNYKGSTFRHFSQQEGLTHDEVNKIVEDENQNIWIGTNGGGFTRISKLLSRSTNVNFITFSGKPNDPINYVRSIFKDKQGNVWIGNRGGVLKYQGNSFTRLSRKEGLPDNNVRSILQDKAGNMWFGTLLGATRYDGKYITNFTMKQGMPADDITCMMEDHNGDIWLGTFSSGAAKMVISGSGNQLRFKITQFTKKEGLNSNQILKIVEDKNGTIWFATSEGITKLVTSNTKDKTTYTLTQLTEKEGLSYNYVNSILQDHKGFLWFGTRYGLSKLIQNPTATSTATNQNSNNSLAGIHKTDHYTGSNILFDTYTYDDGFLGKGVNHDGLCEAKDGSIWICADDRVTVFYPDKIDIDTSAPKIELTGIQLFNQNIPWVSLNDNKDSTLILDNSIKVTGFSFDNLSKWNYLPQNLSLAYNNNHITFNYVGVTMYQPKKVKYQFLLEGFDKVWSVATSRTEASYGNLPQGHYTFKVRAVNSQGKWSEEVYYTFTIRPPWWFTWWAYFFYALLLCVALWRFDHYRRKRIIDRERAKTLEREWAQAQQIEKSFNELKATQAQLIQKEKMASLGELTAGIAHEIQNPLNFVNNFSETNAELIEEAQTELKAGNHEEVDAILMDIKGNEEKINYHGKRADSIVKGMLEHSRSSKGERQATEINALCDEYLRLSYHGFRAKYKSFNATIQTHFDEGIGKTSIVPQEIGRVLLNLFNNAFWAVGEKKKVASDGYVPTVTVMTKRLKDNIEVTVTDNGGGIPQSVIDKVFQPFFTTKPTGQGTGLGLSLSYDIVKAHGGELKVESTEGEGAIFTILLPLT